MQLLLSKLFDFKIIQNGMKSTKQQINTYIPEVDHKCTLHIHIRLGHYKLGWFHQEFWDQNI